MRHSRRQTLPPPKGDLSPLRSDPCARRSDTPNAVWRGPLRASVAHTELTKSGQSKCVRWGRPTRLGNLRLDTSDDVTNARSADSDDSALQVHQPPMHGEQIC